MMAESIAGWLQWLQNSSWAVGVRQSLWLYPAIEIIHITGIVLVAGGAIFFDLRLLGMSKKIAVADMARRSERRAWWLTGDYADFAYDTRPAI